ncbi:MAG: HD domain-containing protein [Bacteroidota bacterium]
MLRIRENRLPLPDTLIESLIATEQNPRYHAEGNVYNHTLLVLEQYQQHQSRFNLTQEESDILYWVAILHDIGKPSVTQWQNGRWTARGHEKAGVPIAREILLQQPEVSPAQRRQILDLIRWHNAPLRWIVNHKPIGEYRKMATRVNLRLLGIFAYFDIMGRICEHKTDILDGIDALLEIHIPQIEQELGNFAELQEKYRKASLQKKNAIWSALKQEDSRLLGKLLDSPALAAKPSFFQCLMALGAGGCTQSEYLKSNYPSHLYYNLNELFKEADTEQERRNKLREVKRFLSVYMRGRKAVLLDTQFIADNTRLEIAEFVRQNGGKMQYLFFERSLEALKKASDTESEAEEISTAYQHLEMPHPWEAHSIEIV